MASRLSYLLTLAAQLLLVKCYDLAEFRFGVAESQGEVYRRLIEPMPQYIAEASICASSQVSILIIDTSTSDDECRMRFVLACFCSQVTPYWWLTSWPSSNHLTGTSNPRRQWTAVNYCVVGE